MAHGVTVLQWLRRHWARLRANDRALALFRGVLFACAVFWTILGPITPRTRLYSALLLGCFLAYGIVAAWLASKRPERAGMIYLCAFVADLGVLYFLFGATGGISSPFLPVAFVLAAVTAFTYGPVIGILAAFMAIGLAVGSDLAGLGKRHWSDLPLMLIFAGLTAAYVGWLARREAKERQDIECLHEDLRERARELEAAYRRCREVQDHLVHSERLATIGRMSAEMAHQVRNPLSSISLNLELLEDEIGRIRRPGPGDSEELLTAIHKEIENLVDVTESYLRFAKLPPFRWEMADLSEVVRGVIFFAKPEIRQRSIKVSQRLQNKLPAVKIDRRQLRFAMLGIVSNALEAMEPAGRLRVKTRMNGSGVDLLISDTGRGIPRENREKIFEPFFTTKQGGTGLGLSLARRIVEAHGGRLSCESIQGVGTTFVVSLPVDGKAYETVGHGKECEQCG